MSKGDRLTLKATRMMRGLTQDEMAEKLNVHRNTYAAWESHPEDISIKNAEEICRILNVTVDEVIFFTK